MKFKYVFLMLLIFIFSTPAFSDLTKEEDQTLHQVAADTGTTLTTVGLTSLATSQAQIAAQLADIDEKLLNECKVSKPSWRCEKKCEKDSDLAASCNCKGLCKARKSVSRGRLLNMNSLMALLGVGSTMWGKGGIEDEDKRTCPQKCPDDQEPRLHEACLKANTSEYGESCDYTIPAGKCDDTDPMVKKDATGFSICAGFTSSGGLSGCEIYKRSCTCTLQGAPYSWDPIKNECLIKNENNPETKDPLANPDDQKLTPDDALTAAEEEAKDKAAAAAAGLAGLGATPTGANGGAGAKNAKGPLTKKDPKLTAKDSAAFRDTSFSGPAGDAAGTQGTASNKKPTDIAGSKDTNGLFEAIRKTYTDYKDAGRFLAADFKSKETKDTKKSKHIRKKG